MYSNWHFVCVDVDILCCQFVSHLSLKQDEILAQSVKGRWKAREKQTYCYKEDFFSHIAEICSLRFVLYCHTFE